jgi:hypothetical protein
VAMGGDERSVVGRGGAGGEHGGGFDCLTLAF